jgi:hypothetical protein
MSGLPGGGTGVSAIASAITGWLQRIDTDLQNIVQTLNKLIGQTSLAVVVPITQGGTGATTAAGARTNLGLGTAATQNASAPTVGGTVASVVLPVAVGHVATFADTLGSVADGGIPVAETTGAWTPALQFNLASVGISYSGQVGTYTRIGREVTCRFIFSLTSKGISTGTATIAGLPFPSNADPTNDGAGGLVVACSFMASLSGAISLQVGASSSTATLLETGATGTAALTDANFNATSTVSGTLTYFV